MHSLYGKSTLMEFFWKRNSFTPGMFCCFPAFITLRRKNTDTFASVCSKMAIFKRPENYPKDMQNSLSFHQLIDHIGEASEWVLVTKFPVVQKIRAVKVRPFHFYFIKQGFFCVFYFDSSYFQNHWKFCNQNSFRSFPNMVNQLVKR